MSKKLQKNRGVVVVGIFLAITVAVFAGLLAYSFWTKGVGGNLDGNTVLPIELPNVDTKNDPPVVDGTEIDKVVDDKNPKACFIGGCSGQLCTDEEGGLSSCEWRPQYACYQTAKCERQSTGKCGWTETSQLQSCLANPPVSSDEY